MCAWLWEYTVIADYTYVLIGTAQSFPSRRYNFIYLHSNCVNVSLYKKTYSDIIDANQANAYASITNYLIGAAIKT